MHDCNFHLPLVNVSNGFCSITTRISTKYEVYFSLQVKISNKQTSASLQPKTMLHGLHRLVLTPVIKVRTRERITKDFKPFIFNIPPE